VGADRPDDGELPPDEHPDRRNDQNGAGDQAARAGNSRAETRTREEYYVGLRVKVSREESAAARQVTAEEQAASQKWQEQAAESRWMWTEYKRRWPPEERPPVDRSKDEPGSWRSDRVRYLASAHNAEVELQCNHIEDLERETISPRLYEIEGCDPDRYLVGLEHRLKGRDRIKEKVSDSIRLKHHTPMEAISLIPDAIRFTLQYDEARYAQGVRADIDRMKEQGFELDILKNSWSGDQYKGINSQWTDLRTGQRLELQFHTLISFEAKQITHEAYERLRSKQADAFEELVLEAFQKKVTADVPIPLGAKDIPDYPERGRDAG